VVAVVAVVAAIPVSERLMTSAMSVLVFMVV
jgi:hypothetical protein